MDWHLAHGVKALGGYHQSRERAGHRQAAIGGPSGRLINGQDS